LRQNNPKPLPHFEETVQITSMEEFKDFETKIEDFEQFKKTVTRFLSYCVAHYGYLLVVKRKLFFVFL